MTFQHVGLLLPENNNPNASSSRPATQNDLGSQANRTPHPQHLPSPPSSQLPGPSHTQPPDNQPSNNPPSRSSSSTRPTARPAAAPNAPAASSSSATVQPASQPNAPPPVIIPPQSAPTVLAQPPTQPNAAQPNRAAQPNLAAHLDLAAQPDPAAQRRLTERAALRARLLELEAEENNSVHPPANMLPDPLAALFADPATVERARATAAAAHSDSKKVALPDLIPGFKPTRSMQVSTCPLHRCIHIVVCTLSYHIVIPHRRATSSYTTLVSFISS